MEETDGKPDMSHNTATNRHGSVILSTESTGNIEYQVPPYVQIGYSGVKQINTENHLTVDKLDPEPINEMTVLPLPMCRFVQVNWDASENTHTDQPQSSWEDVVDTSSVSPPSTFQEGNNGFLHRTRRKRRPFSPELIHASNRKNSSKLKMKKKCVVSNLSETEAEVSDSKTFSCDNCHSPFIVDPTRCRLPLSQLRKKPAQRRKMDPVTKRVLTLCNACGLAMSRPPKKVIDLQHPFQPTPSTVDRDKYLAEAITFAKTIAQQFEEPIAERLYCPSFKRRPCGCIQSYLSEQGEGNEDSLETRVSHLLHFLKTACHLGRRRNILPEIDDTAHDGAMTADTDGSFSAVERKQRLRQLEQFILDTRQHLREKLHLCERACQRVLLYSNNFLHKRLKSAPDQGSRLSRQPGRNSSSHLKPVLELSSVSCCSDSCSRLALTHSKLLEEWRDQASQGQRQARRVLAEMLTPSGGTKANCYRFISMVTGCSFTTISSVSQQMRITKGDREPPEHGLKKWYREHPKNKLSTATAQSAHSDHSYDATTVSHPPVVNIHVPNQAELSSIEGPNATQKLQEQRQHLEEAKKQLALKQQEIDQCQQFIDQQLRQQTIQYYIPSEEEVLKVDVQKSSLKKNDLLNSTLHVNSCSEVTIMQGGRLVQLLDIVPGTYLAVPSDHNHSAILTVSADPKQTAISETESNTVIPNILSNQQVAFGTEILHAIPSMDVKDSIAISAQTNVPTYFNMTPELGAVQPILNVETDNTQQAIHFLEVPVTECPVSSDSSSGHHSNISIMTSSGHLQPLSTMSSQHSGISLLTSAVELESLSNSQCSETLTHASCVDHSIISVISAEELEPLTSNSGLESCMSVITSTGELKSVPSHSEQSNHGQPKDSCVEVPMLDQHTNINVRHTPFTSGVLLPTSVQSAHSIDHSDSFEKFLR